MNDLLRKWYAAPGYGGGGTDIARSDHVVDAAGELVCVCETLEIAEHIAAQHNIWLSWKGRESSLERSGTG